MPTELTCEQIFCLYQNTLLEVTDAATNADSCVSDVNASKGSLELVGRELNGHIERLVRYWESLCVHLSEDENRLKSLGTDYRHSRRSCQKTLQNVIDKIASIEACTSQPPPPASPIVVPTLPTPKLPAIKIPTFDGKLENWSSFWDIFDSLVHSRTDLTNVVKFATLRNYLTDRAFRSIEGLAVTNSNYSIAIKTLTDCFHNEDKLLSQLIRELNDLPVPRHSHDELLDFKLNYEKLLAQINHLEQQDTSSRLFREILIKKLPSETFKVLVNKYDTYHFTVKQISEGLNKIVDLMERCKEQPRSERKPENASANSSQCDSSNTSKFNNSSQSHSKVKQNPTAKNASFPNNQNSQSSQYSSQNNQTNNYKPCLFCEQPHSSKHCIRYPSFQSRRERVRALNLCFCCLKPGHAVRDCQLKFECRNCNGNNHHTFLCYKLCNNTVANPSQYASTNIANSKPFNSAAAANTSSLPNFNPKHPPPPILHQGSKPIVNVANSASPTVNNTSVNVASFTNSCSSNTASSLSITALPTALVQISGGGHRVPTRTFFDTGSQRTFIDSDLANQLGLPVVDRITLSLTPFASQPVEIVCNVVKVVIRLGKSRIPLKAVAFDKVNTVIRTPGLINVVNFLKSKGIKLADSQLSSDDVTQIGIVIGADNYHKFKMGQSKCAGVNLFTCAAGAIIFGPLPQWATQDFCNNNSVTVQHAVCARTNVMPVEIEPPQIENLWKLDQVGIVDETYSPEEKLTVEKFESNISCIGNQYSVDLPFKSNLRPPVNYRRAYGQLVSLARSFQNNPAFFEEYNQILDSYVNLGFIEKVNEPILGHYLPHHGVRKDSATTPLRIVFNASSKQSVTDPSLNDCLLTGPSLTAKLLDYLLAFRTNPFAVVSDISKAFLRIGINFNSRDYCRFLWFADSNLDKIVTYRFKVVMFGATCSPFLLQKTIVYHLEHNSDPLASQLIPHFYVDNFCKTYCSLDLMLKEYPRINQILLEANMPLQSWTSNSVKFNEEINANVREVEINVLGIVWNVTSDTLSIKTSPYVCKNECFHHHLTKRHVVSIVASIFDPLGLVSPLWIQGKIFIQSLWKEKFGWDESLPREYCHAFKSICMSLNQVSSIKFPRFAIIPGNSHLHIFVDASKQAYGLSVYVATPCSSNLLLSKARVAPKPELSIPKLELTALNLGSKMAKSLMSNSALNFKSCTLWTDSEVALHWVHRNKCTDVYVRNRVGEIREREFPIKYVPTKENPADLLTRGLSPTKLMSSLWLSGPTWLNTPSQYPPQREFEPTLVSEILVEPVQIQPIIPCLDLSKYSLLFRVLKIVRRIIQFCRNLKPDKPMFCLDPLIVLVKMEQRFHYPTLIHYLSTASHVNIPQDIKNFANQLGLYLNSNDVVCSKGRLQNSTLPDSTQTPMLLPPKSNLTHLIIRHYHISHHHSNVNTVLVLLRETFWLPKARRTIKNLLSKCVLCRKLRAQTCIVPSPPPLPSERVTFTRPFDCIGVDFTGAYNVYDVDSESLSDVPSKAYICLFTCTTSRAIHLELVRTLSTVDFLLAFRRFCALYSTPRVIISDNGSNFHGCNQFLQQIKDEPEVISHLNNLSIQWKFITPRAPWFGGFYERLIGVTKGCLSKALYHKRVTFDELHTVLCEIKSIVNNRPLTYISDSCEEEFLTPNQLLYGRNIVIAPPLNTLTDNEIPYGENVDVREQYARLCSVLRKFENIWQRDYLTSLRERHYGNQSSSVNPLSLQVDDVVLVNLENNHKFLWPLGKITRLIYGRDDNAVRSVEVLINGKLYERSISKIVPLEIPNPVLTEELNGARSYEDLNLPKVPVPSVPMRPGRAAAKKAAHNRKQLIMQGQL